MKCWFCTIRDAVSKHALTYQMYGDVDTQKTDSETKVAYNVRQIEIPRCADCHSRHQHAFTTLIMVAALLVSLIAAILAGVFELTAEWIWALWAGLSGGMLIGAAITYLTLLRGTLSQFYARKNYPELKDLCEKGYRFGHRPKDTPSIDNKDQDD